ncbi:allophanate hydrolase subunit 1 [Flammeovirgaceae bacterium 311]|nr:allophanate hydrolase subunit 1 [Flammeovirgaceae bacterium 311]
MEDQSASILTAPAPLQYYPLGDNAIVINFGNSISRELHQTIQAFIALLAQNPLHGIIEWVPAYTTLTVYYDPWLLSDHGRQLPHTKLTQHLSSLAAELKPDQPVQGRLIDIPVCYGGKYGPDLEIVASYHKISPEEVIILHSQQEYMVHMIGFAPGFPYLGGLNPKIATPRKETPRQHVPAGSVGIAGLQTGIYPLATLGGWQILGQTPLVLFDPKRQPPSLLQAGDRLRFTPVSAEELHQKIERQA